ncbi:hypothetical protein SFC65_19580 [Priestia filamentosa]|uniref:hypothetical protein n=1 Tax=Priestia filamentosa TaxID=1402861 RepID=UPI003981E76B
MSTRYYIKDYRTNIQWLDNFFLHTKINTLDYKWIFSNLRANAFKEGKEIADSIFYKESFTLTGQELDQLLKEEEVLIMFGVLVAVKEDISLERTKELPIIEGNPNYWNENYVSPIKNAIVEFGFFNGEIAITTENKDMVEMLRKNVSRFPDLISFREYR